MGHPVHRRHTYISLQVHAGLSPIIVAALAGNSPEVIWKHYAREFDRSRTTKAVSLDAALKAARRAVAQTGATIVRPRGDLAGLDQVSDEHVIPAHHRIL
jgi:hypothetical protein